MLYKLEIVYYSLIESLIHMLLKVEDLFYFIFLEGPKRFLIWLDILLHTMPCKFNNHDWHYIPPDNYKAIYEYLECSCGSIFRSMTDFHDHHRYMVPACRFNRVCMRCKKVDLQLEKYVSALSVQLDRDNIAKDMVTKEIKNFYKKEGE